MGPCFDDRRNQSTVDRQIGFQTPNSALYQISDNTPIDGQNLVYSSSTGQYEPKSIVTSDQADAIQLLNQARYWVVAGENADRNNNYTLHDEGTGWTTGTDNDGYTWAQGNYQNCKEIRDSNAFIDRFDRSLTYAFVADFVIPSTNSGWSSSADTIVIQDPLSGLRSNHAVNFIYGDIPDNYNWGQTRGNLIYDNYEPSSNDDDATQSNNSLMSDVSAYLGQKNLYVITIQPGSTYQIKSNFYMNGTFLQSVEANDVYTDSSTLANTNIIDSIKFGTTPNSNNGGGQSKFYGIAAWPRTLSYAELSQLTIPLLLKPRTKFVTTFPVSSITPTDGQALLYDSSNNVWEPGTIVTTSSSTSGGVSTTATIPAVLPFHNLNSNQFLKTVFRTLQVNDEVNDIMLETETQLCGGSLLQNGISSVTASSGSTAGKLFDNDVGSHTTGWHGSNTNGIDQIQIRFTEPRALSKFIMFHRSGFAVQFPKTFSLYGSNTQPSSVGDVSNMTLIFDTSGAGLSAPTPNSYSQTNAQDDLSLGREFVIPEINRRKYEYYTFAFTAPWGTSSNYHFIVITEMILFHHPLDNNKNFDVIFNSLSNDTRQSGSSFDTSGMSTVSTLNQTYVLDNTSTNNTTTNAEFGYYSDGTSSTLATSVPSSPFDINTFTEDGRIHVRLFPRHFESGDNNFYTAGTLTIDTSKLMTDYAGFGNSQFITTKKQKSRSTEAFSFQKLQRY